MAARTRTTLVACGCALVLAVAFRLLADRAGLTWPEGQHFELRLSRALLGVVVGAALGASGVMLQSLLRNPLASPDLIGLASGAGLAIVVASYLGIATGAAFLAGESREVAALVGSFGALAVVYLLAQRRGLIEPVSLILVGVIVGVICSAATSFVSHLMPAQTRIDTMRWMFGSLRDDVGVGRIAGVGAVVAAGIGVAWWHGRAMDASAMGDDEAASVGVHVGRLRAALFVASGVLAAASVVLAGPIGFVGLVCPHLVRLGAGPGHRALVIGAAMAGAALVVGADGLVRAIWLETGRMPIGVLTSMVGGPVFVVLLRREMRGRLEGE
jgi:iron complex transport system permease protein